MGGPNDAEKSKAAAAYNSAADHYDANPLAFWDRYGRRTVARLALVPGAEVLDVGCGSGASTLPAAEIVGPRGHVVGIDLAERLLELGRAKAANHGLINIEFRHADMEDLGFADGAFDAVISVFSLFFVTDIAAQLRELWRMVRPGGQLAITSWGPRLFEPVGSIWRAAVKRERPDLYASGKPWDRLSDPGALAELLREAGIGHAEIVAEDGVQPLGRPEDWWTIVLGSGTRGRVEQMDPLHVARVRGETVGWLREHDVREIETNVIYAVATKD
jgi:ubiquinone/menaquinone biosynthesis C-methylase UbiE